MGSQNSIDENLLAHNTVIFALVRLLEQDKPGSAKRLIESLKTYAGSMAIKNKKAAERVEKVISALHSATPSQTDIDFVISELVRSAD